MNCISKIRRIVRYAKLIIKNEPVRSWRKLENGKYICDGDCGRWSLHGVCTCGLCHLLKIEEGGHDRIERDIVSWAREGDTEQHMMSVPRREHCPHGRHLNTPGLCLECQKEFEQFWIEWNKNENYPTTS